MEIAELLVSEVVTNAVVHAATDIDLSVAVLPGRRVRVEVSDGSGQLPSRREYPATATTGRGLHLLEELADASGTVRSATGKTVWFEVSPGPAAPHTTASPGPPSAASGSEDAVPVALLGVPPRLLAVWHEQADAMLQDHLLASLDHAGADEQVARHAVCSAAMSLLVEQMPADAADPSSVDVVVPVPVARVADFDVLDETLDQAIARADEGSLLPPATDEAVRELRRWVCREVRRQAAGSPPVPWQPQRVADRVSGAKSTFSRTPQSGQHQSSGIEDQDVPGGKPSRSSPTASS